MKTKKNYNKDIENFKIIVRYKRQQGLVKP